jgi:hypothetical protein
MVSLLTYLLYVETLSEKAIGKMAVKPVKTVTTSDAKKGAEKKSKDEKVDGLKITDVKAVQGFKIKYPHTYDEPSPRLEEDLQHVYLLRSDMDSNQVVTSILTTITKGIN